MAEKIVIPSQLGRKKGASFVAQISKKEMEELEEHSGSNAMGRRTRFMFTALANSGAELARIGMDNPALYSEMRELVGEFREHAEVLLRAANAAVGRLRSADFQENDPARLINTEERKNLSRNIFGWLRDATPAIRLGFAKLLVGKVHEQYGVRRVSDIRRKSLRSVLCKTSRWSDDVFHALHYGNARGIITEADCARILYTKVEIVRGHLRLVHSS